MKFDPAIHRRAQGMALVSAIPQHNPNSPGDYWLDPDGVHLHAVWNITKAGQPDRRARPDVLVHRQPPTKWNPEGQIVGRYILVTPANVEAVREYARESAEIDLALERAEAKLHAAVAIVLPAKPEVSA